VHFDLEMILLIGSVLTGLVWLLDVFVLRARREKSIDVDGGAAALGGHEPWYVEYAKSFFPVLLIVLILRSFIAEPFRIPSGSMMPTLLVGDFILVNKFAYGIRLPVLHTRILKGKDLQRGDVVVFRYPRDPSLDYIKRVVGLPGDRIGYVDKTLYINGKPIDKTLQGPYVDGGAYAQPNEFLFNEDLDGVQHDVILNHSRQRFDAEYVVPDNHYFAMGDNRDNSNDSRYWGFVPEENLVGKALLIWMNWDFSKNSLDFGRIGNSIK
jgi:signal peptidase I